MVSSRSWCRALQPGAGVRAACRARVTAAPGERHSPPSRRCQVGLGIRSPSACLGDGGTPGGSPCSRLSRLCLQSGPRGKGGSGGKGVMPRGGAGARRAGQRGCISSVPLLSSPLHFSRGWRGGNDISFLSCERVRAPVLSPLTPLKIEIMIMRVS